MNTTQQKINEILKYKRLFQKTMKRPGRTLIEEAVFIFIAAEAVALALQIGLPLLFGR